MIGGGLGGLCDMGAGLGGLCQTGGGLGGLQLRGGWVNCIGGPAMKAATGAS